MSGPTVRPPVHAWRCPHCRLTVPSHSALSIHLMWICPVKMLNRYGPQWAAYTESPAVRLFGVQS